VNDHRRGIKILTENGARYDSPAAARRLLDRGRARAVDAWTIQEIPASDTQPPAGRSAPRSLAHSPSRHPVLYNYTGSDNLRTFARYPVDARNFGRSFA
jgi:hypothetical protein